MKRGKSGGMPAAAILAGGISQHGRGCYCRYCREDDSPVRSTAAIDDVFAATRAAVVEPMCDITWSPAQHVRRTEAK